MVGNKCYPYSNLENDVLFKKTFINSPKKHERRTARASNVDQLKHSLHFKGKKTDYLKKKLSNVFTQKKYMNVQ